MNAHTVADVLNRVTGVFSSFSQGTGSLGSTSLFYAQGSEPRHVLVLVDGIKWNSLSGGTAETSSIPVGIIDRIEIIKGPASSSWGSSLGGVVHIITKSPGFAAGPGGSVQAAFGEHDTQDYRAQVSGRNGRFGYYLFGGRQSSDGVDDAREFKKDSFFSKLAYAVSDRVELSGSIGYSQPDAGLGTFTRIDVISSSEIEMYWSTVQLDAFLSRELTFNLRLFGFAQNSNITNNSMGLGFAGPPGDLYQRTDYEEQTTGAAAQLVWRKGNHTAVLGADYDHGNLEQTIDSGQVLQSMTAPARLRTHPDLYRTGIYLNDTIVLDRFAITPGIRYDHNNITDSFFSPSLGLTYSLGKETLLRASVARGFTTPGLSWLSGGALFLDPNPALEEETVWSYQAGFETAALQYAWIKATLFRHEIDELLAQASSTQDPRNFYRRFVNKGESRRQGFEFEFETLPVYYITLQAGTAYVDFDPVKDDGSSEIYAHNIGIVFDKPDLLRAELFGHYIWWDDKIYVNADYDDVIWDLNIQKKIYRGQRAAVDLFFTCHNLFNGSQYLVADNKNPDRWAEAGVRFGF